MSLAMGCSKSEAPPPTEGEELTYKDGTYTAKGDTDENGWTPEVEVTVKSGKVTEVKFDEVRGMYKTEDSEYQKSFKDATDIELNEIYKKFAQNLITAQDINKIDTVTGATGSFDTFKTLASKAIEQAKDGNQLKDGEYKVDGKEDDRGWTPFVKISVKDSKIDSVIFDEISSKSFVYKTKDSDYKENFMNINKVDLESVYGKFEEELIHKQDPEQVDATGGATQSGKKFIELSKKALQQAQ